MTLPYTVAIDPVAFRLGPVAIHWYGLMYLGGYLGAWLLACALLLKSIHSRRRARHGEQTCWNDRLEPRL